MAQTAADLLVDVVHELDKVFTDVAKYSVRVIGSTHVENVAHIACRTALLYRGVAHLAFPADLQEQGSEPNDRRAMSPATWPRVSARQAAKFGEALLKGQPNRDKIALTVLADKVRELV